MTVDSIMIVGAGTMGCGIARAAAAAGFQVLLMDRDRSRVEMGVERIAKALQALVGRGRLEEGEKVALLNRIRICDRFDQGREADLVIEAVAEKEAIKREVFQALDGVCPDHTLFATNTSSISVTRLAAATHRAPSFVGMHFMNPAHVMKLVEVIVGFETAPATADTVMEVAGRMGKTSVVVADSPGFVANRVLMPMINDAISCLQEGLASREDIDAIARLGAHHPMGPLELADFIGLDVCLEILKVLHDELGEKYRPNSLLRKMVAAGRLGRKSGAGFYEYG